MTNKETRVLRFVLERKTPVDTKMVADRFVISQSTAATYLRRLYGANCITRTEKKGKVLWGRKPEEKPVSLAIPKDIAELPIAPAFNRPIQNSYPLIRGYDD